MRALDNNHFAHVIKRDHGKKSFLENFFQV